MKQKRKPFMIYMSDETKTLFAEAAVQRDMDLGPWLVQAGLSYARSAKRSAPKNATTSTWPSGWPKDSRCPNCNKLHDPVEVHAEFYPQGLGAMIDLAKDFR